MIDLNKHAEAIKEAYDCRKIGDSLEEYWERRDAAIFAACAALADDAAGAMREKAADTVNRRHGWPTHDYEGGFQDVAAIRAIEPASLRGEK